MSFSYEEKAKQDDKDKVFLIWQQRQKKKKETS